MKKPKEHDIYLSIVSICGENDLDKLEEFLKFLPKDKRIEIIVMKNKIVSGQIIRDFKPVLLNEIENFKLYEMQVNDLDFGYLRNQAKSVARGEWILSIDIDEYIPNIYHKDILEVLSKQKQDVEGLRVGIVSDLVDYLNEEMYVSYLSRPTRIFRNNKNNNWLGSIHEMICQQYPEKVLDSNIKLIHFGYEISNEEMKLKYLRNIRLIAREIYFQTDVNLLEYYRDYMYKSLVTLENIK